jgi:putative nucleotidyltransferase with HDIG domain
MRTETDFRRAIATRIFLSSVLFLGLVAMVSEATQFTVSEPVKLACFSVIALVAATLKVTIPGITGTLSVNYVIVLIGLTELSLPECLFAGTVAAIVQCYAHAQRRPSAIQLLFNVANFGISIVCCQSVYSSPYLRAQGLGTLMLLTLSSIAYFLMNTFAVTGIISLTESKSLLRIWKECYLWSFPFFFIGAGIAWAFHRVAALYGWQIATLGLPGIYILYSAYRFYLGRLQSEKVHAQEMASLHLRTIEALAMAIDAKDTTTHDHLRRVQVYATEIGKELNLPALEMEALQGAAMLHDVGKLAVPEHIISKPGKLTPEEFEKMKIHPVVGAEILERVQFPYPVCRSFVPTMRNGMEQDTRMASWARLFLSERASCRQ